MRYFVESYGCTMNHGESEQLSRKMSFLGHIRTKSLEEADIVIFNTCTVVGLTEKKMMCRMNILRNLGKKVVVTGCMAKVQPKKILERLPGSLVVAPDEYDLFSGRISSTFGCTRLVNILLYDTCAVIPIAQGCFGDCSYCITRYARGILKSRPEEELVEEFERMLSSGVREILIAAQDTACYGKDRKTSLPRLLERFLEHSGNYRIRVGMMNPNSLDLILDDLLDLMGRDDRVYRFLHIPVQSGSDRVLESMKRHYTAEHFLKIVNSIRCKYPDFSIATDIITGFPGEDNNDHAKTIELVKRIRVDTLNITRFSSRPGTEAAQMNNQINGNLSKERSKELTKIKMEIGYSVNKEHIGRTYRVLVTENGKTGTVITRNGNYRPICINHVIPLGSIISVKVTGCTSTYLIGEIINN